MTPYSGEPSAEQYVPDAEDMAPYSGEPSAEQFVPDAEVMTPYSGEPGAEQPDPGFETTYYQGDISPTLAAQEENPEVYP